MTMYGGGVSGSGGKTMERPSLGGNEGAVDCSVVVVGVANESRSVFSIVGYAKGDASELRIERWERGRRASDEMVVSTVVGDSLI